MEENNSRQNLIENCLEKRLSRYETNKILNKHCFDKLEGGEADCYDVLINSAVKSNPRQKIIAGCLIQGLSKTQANLKLYENKYRKLSGDEIIYYEDVLSRVRFCGVKIKSKEFEKQEYVPPRSQIIAKGLLNKQSVSEITKVLNKYNYSELSKEEIQKYEIDFERIHNKRESIIAEALNLLQSIDTLNRKLKTNNLPKLNLLEEMNYQKEREKIYNKKRNNLIKECIAERLSKTETDKVLISKGFEKLSEQETDKIKKENHSVNQNRTKRKSTELSDQFRKLYREATKQFHPDRFSNPEQKNKANRRMKEINSAKDKNDFFMLKDLLQKYKEEDSYLSNN